ncbi:MAG: hypothetical protein JRH18_05025 [Deltaproteobacteria bacterium]|nr:hypothetical protein [Deltaproteobacteria bacterium]MBW1993525.1 hypothetical protein [Deltaproteobacteria bacterium]MBW2151008.1 hypothetical protein [Deltaproteobacteria bacterium]
MGKTIVFWILGLYISLFLGGFFTSLFRGYLMEKAGGSEHEDQEPSGVQDWIFDSMERLFFTLAAAYSVGGAVVGMMIWMGMKMITHRFWPTGASRSSAEAVRFLTVSMSSMIFALIGGLFCRV